MARLRHVAVVVKDLEKAADFYAQVFELERVGREDLDIGSAIYMSDGVINMALLNFKGGAGSKASDLKEGSTFVGAHHFGFQVDDLVETQRRIEEHGGTFFFDLGDERKGNFERKFKDPDGVIFDISHHGWAGTDGSKK
jgi:catechol 2,3-dioxygenase-like lactoylglutathione lyase family enzyme